MLGFFLTSSKVDIDKRIEFGNDDVDIVATDAVRDAREAFATIGASDGVELATRDVALDCVEMRGYEVDAFRVATKEDCGGYLVGTDVKMEDRAVVVDD